MQDDLKSDPVLRDTHMLGIDPTIPFYDLNLAGAQGIPAPADLVHTAQAETNAPTFTCPDTSTPLLAMGDLTDPGIDLRPAFTAEPLVPDLSAYAHPIGLDIQPAMSTGKLLDDHPNGLDITHDILAADPLVPDLQHPDLTQQTHMQGRPGELDEAALQVMHLGATYQQLGAKAYPEIFMDQAGMNSARSRHMDLLMRGLDEEER